MSVSQQSDRLLKELGELNVFERDGVLAYLIGRLECEVEVGTKAKQQHAKYALKQITVSIRAAKKHRPGQQQAAKINDGE